MNLRNLNIIYSEEVNDNLVCTICCQPFIHPVATPCKHYFCNQCLNLALEVKEECPIDRLPLNSLLLEEVPPIISNMTNELVVYCINKEKGCSYKCQRSLLINHIYNCEFSKDEMNETNDEISKLKNNENKCPHCFEIIESEWIRHVLACDKLKVSCRCQRYGCDWKGIKHDLNEHNERCYYIKLEPILAKQETRISELENTNTQLKAVLQELNIKLKHTVDELQEMRSNTGSSNNNIDPQVRPPNYPGEEIAAAMLERMHLEHQRLRYEVINLTSNLASVDLKHEMALASETLQLREQVQALRTSYQTLRSDYDRLNHERQGSTIAALANLAKVSARNGRPNSFIHSSKPGSSTSYKL